MGLAWEGQKLSCDRSTSQSFTEMSFLSQGSLTNVTSNFHTPYMDVSLYIFQGLPTSSIQLVWHQLWGQLDKGVETPF